MADIIFIDNTVQVKKEITSAVLAVLEEVAGELESQVKRNTRVKTGRTKNSWQHKVYSTADGAEAIIGSDSENAIWEEFGTGEYALEGNGRKGGWRYKDEMGHWHFTRGKMPTRAFFNAYNSKKSWIIDHIKNRLGGI